VNSVSDEKNEYLSAWVMYFNVVVLIPLVPGFVVAVRTESIWYGVVAFLLTSLYVKADLYLIRKTKPIRGGR
jgi:hypothetical protein